MSPHVSRVSADCSRLPTSLTVLCLHARKYLSGFLFFQKKILFMLFKYISMPPDGGSLYSSFKKWYWKTNIQIKHDKGAFFTPLLQIELTSHENMEGNRTKGWNGYYSNRLTGLSHPFVLCYSSFACICLVEQLYNVILSTSPNSAWHTAPAWATDTYRWPKHWQPGGAPKCSVSTWQFPSKKLQIFPAWCYIFITYSFNVQ